MSIKRILPDDSVITSTLQAQAGSSLILDGYIADGSSAVGVVINNLNTLSNSAAKIASFQNNGTEKAYVREDGAALFNSTVFAGGGSGTIFAGTLDNSTAAALTIGNTNATSIAIGKSSITTSLISNQINLGPGSGSTALLIVGSTQGTNDTAGVGLTIQASGGGTASATGGGSGGSTTIKGAPGGNGVSALNPGAGGELLLQSGSAGTGGSGNANSGNMIFNIPTASGTGTQGQFSWQSNGATKVILIPSTSVFAPGTTNTGSLGNSSTVWGSVYATAALTDSVDTITSTALSLGGSTATSIGIGKSGITTTLTGSFVQQTGSFSLTGNGNSGITSTAGSVSYDAYSNASLGATHASSVSIGHSGTTTTISGTLVVDGYTISPSNAASGQALVYNGSAYVPTSVSGTIGGSIAVSQVAYAGSTNTLKGSNNLIYDGYVLELTAGSDSSTGLIIQSWSPTQSSNLLTTWDSYGIARAGIEPTLDGNESMSLFVSSSIGTAQTPGLSLQNTEAATSSVTSQYSPTLELVSNVWNGSGSLTGKVCAQLQTTSEGSYTQNDIHLFADKGDGSGYSDQGTFSIGSPGFSTALVLTSGPVGLSLLAAPYDIAQLSYGGYTFSIGGGGVNVNNGGAPLGFYGATPIGQPTGTGTSAGFTANTGTPVLSGSTSTGGVGSTAYSLGDIVAALKNLGLITS